MANVGLYATTERGVLTGTIEMGILLTTSGSGHKVVLALKNSGSGKDNLMYIDSDGTTYKAYAYDIKSNGGSGSVYMIESKDS